MWQAADSPATSKVMQHLLHQLLARPGSLGHSPLYTRTHTRTHAVKLAQGQLRVVHVSWRITCVYIVYLPLTNITSRLWDKTRVVSSGHKGLPDTVCCGMSCCYLCLARTPHTHAQKKRSGLNECWGRGGAGKGTKR